LLGENPIEFLVAETAVGDNADLDVRWQGVGEADQDLILILVAMVLECGGVDGEPEQRRSAAVAGQQR